ncbi:hypothetical protein Q5P01_021832 [Channa striata]|uniref:G-protein coupled receptors family 1 profile domain-containing protein n=1 Tax=Channa striata TaxID=64152 RepID=A0AA88LUV0_CHASR|nr:hypothetical protein Q5P01_021832 [Channa striata]
MDNFYTNASRNQSEVPAKYFDSKAIYVLTCAVISISLPLNLVAIYALHLLVQKDHVAPIYVINLLVSDLIQLCSMVVRVVKPEDPSIVFIFFKTYFFALMVSVGFMVCIALERSSNSSISDGVNGGSVQLVMTCTILAVSLPLTLVAMYAVFSQVRTDNVAPIYVINVLFSDLIQLCCMITGLVQCLPSSEVSCVYHWSVMAGVGFMVCVALERYLVIAWPLWYHFRRTAKVSLVVSVIVWALPLVYILPVYFQVDFKVQETILAVFFLLPYPLLMFFLCGTLKALSAAISVPLDEKRRIVAILVLVLLIYTLLFLPSAIWSLAANSRDNSSFSDLSFTVRKDHGAPIYVINLLIADLIQLCSLTVSMIETADIISETFYYLYYFSQLASVGFMACVLGHRPANVVPLQTTVKFSVMVCVVVWVLPLVYILPVYFWVPFNVAETIFAVFLLLPFPLFIFSLCGTLKALSAASRVPPDEKRRIVAMLVLVLLIYTLLFLPSAIWSLSEKTRYNSDFSDMSFIIVQFSPLADSFLYVLLRKGAVDKVLASVCCCRMESNDVNPTTTVEN